MKLHLPVGAVLCCSLTSLGFAGDLAPGELGREPPAIAARTLAGSQGATVLAQKSYRPDLSPVSDLGNAISIVQQGDKNGVLGLQAGIGNLTQSSQISGNNQFDVSQQGDRNSVLSQQAGNDRASLQQSGLGNRAEIQQVPGGPAISIRQSGVNSFIRATQY